MKQYSFLTLVGLYSMFILGFATKSATAAAETPAAAPAPATSVHAAEHAGHDHVHGPKCGHKAVKHGDHTDYIHDGHYHAQHDTHVDDHGILKTSTDACAQHAGHEHKHGAKCGHKSVKHDTHVDYQHDGHMHTAHNDHTDEHSATN